MLIEDDHAIVLFINFIPSKLCTAVPYVAPLKMNIEEEFTVSTPHSSF